MRTVNTVDVERVDLLGMRSQVSLVRHRLYELSSQIQAAQGVYDILEWACDGPLLQVELCLNGYQKELPPPKGDDAS